MPFRLQLFKVIIFLKISLNISMVFSQNIDYLMDLGSPDLAEYQELVFEKKYGVVFSQTTSR